MLKCKKKKSCKLALENEQSTDYPGTARWPVRLYLWTFLYEILTVAIFGVKLSFCRRFGAIQALMY